MKNRLQKAVHMTDRITLAASGDSFDIDHGETILAAALRHGIVIPHNCRNGFCGSCMGKLVNGRVSYDDEQALKGIDAEQRAQGYVLCCRAMAESDIEIDIQTIDAAADIEIKTLPARVRRLERMAHDVMLVELSLPPHESLRFHAGQYLDVLLPDGRRRSFSMANSPYQADVIELHVRQVPGGDFTGRVFNELKEKDMLRVQGPFGTFFMPEHSRRPAILIAGGTGFAPIKSMLEKIRMDGCERPLHLFWGARTERDLYQDGLLREWLQQLECLQYTPVLSEADSSWSGKTGLVHEAVLADYPDLEGFEIYASGPPPMIDAIKQSFPAAGMHADDLFYDAFDYAIDGR
jgi:CDP-4-dehydro-6-deoxyglucose reductase